MVGYCFALAAAIVVSLNKSNFLIGLMGLWSLVIGWKLYTQREGWIRSGINYFQFHQGLDIIVLVGVAIATVSLGIGPFSALMSLIVALVVLGGDFWFCSWCVTILKSFELEDSEAQLVTDHSSPLKKTLAELFMWTTVFAIGVTSYLGNRSIQRSRSVLISRYKVSPQGWQVVMQSVELPSGLGRTTLKYFVEFQKNKRISISRRANCFGA